MADLRIEYDDGPEDILDAVNAALAEIGYTFVDDGEEHDGYCLYHLAEVE